MSGDQFTATGHYVRGCQLLAESEAQNPSVPGSSTKAAQAAAHFAAAKALLCLALATQITGKGLAPLLKHGWGAFE